MMVSNVTVPLVGIADMTVAGQLNDPVLLGGVSLGSTIFAMLFWAFGFLRRGTTGLTAQAAGADDKAAIAANLYRPLIIAAAAGAALFIIHVPAMVLTLQLIGGSPALQTATAAYLGVRIMSAPATLANYALTGWFIGLARANLALALQLFLNAINIMLTIAVMLFAQMGVKGAALAAVFAGYAAVGVGLLIAARILRENRGMRTPLFERQAFKKLLAVNGDIMIRTVCPMFAFTFFAAQGARLRDIALAANSVLRALTDLSIYVLDGFAFAAEVLAGQAAGAKSLLRFRRAVLLSSVWGMALSIIVSAASWAGGLFLIQFMTGAPAVREAAQELLPCPA
jgi:multidrug resistance protein, MATE family